MIQRTINPQDCVAIIKKRLSLILVITLAGFLLALIISIMISPTYEAVTSLRVKVPRGLAVSLLSDMPGSSPLDTRQNLANYAEMLKSRTVVQSVIDKVYADEDYVPRYEQLVKVINVQPSKTADILYLQVQAGNPEEAQIIANTLSETLISLLTAEQGAVREFIGQRLSESKQELEKAESALEVYKRTQKMIAPDVQSKAMLDKVISIDKLRAENRVNLMSAQARLSSIERQLAGEKPGFIADNPLIQQYKSKLADLEVELVSTLPKYSDNHPKVISLRAAINDVKAKLQDEAALVVNADAASGNAIHQNLLQGKITAEAEVAATMAQQAAIENIIAASEKEMSTLPAKEQGISRLMREALVAQEIYIMLDKRYEEARINEVMRPSDVKVLDAAIAPEKPIKPRKILNAIIGAFLGLFIGILLAFFLEYTNWTIRNDQEAKELLDLPVIGIVPDFGKIVIDKKEPLWCKVSKLFFHRK